MQYDPNYSSYVQQNSAGFNPYAAGQKQYGMTGAPTIGLVDLQGYAERDRQGMQMRNAALRRLQAMQQGRPLSSAALQTPDMTTPRGMM